MIHLDYRDARPIYVQIADGIRSQILSGVLQPEDRMPSVREMAAQLTINPNTIQRSYRLLEEEGWIVSVPGKGSFACPPPDQALEQQKALLQTFDETVSRLLASGITRKMLAARLEEGAYCND